MSAKGPIRGDRVMPSFMNPEVYLLTHERIVQANDEGCDAYEAGLSLTANPYGINNRRLQDEWEGAWLDTQSYWMRRRSMTASKPPALDVEIVGEAKLAAG